MIRCTLRLPEKTRGRVTGHYDLTGVFDPLPSGLAQVVVCWRKDALSTRTIRRIRAALRPERTVRRYLDRLPAAARAASWREAKRRGARFLREDHVGHVTIALRRGRRGDRWDVRLARGQGETHWQRVARVELVEVDE